MTALIQTGIKSNAVFIIDLADDSEHLSEPIIKLVSGLFPYSKIHFMRDERTRNFCEYIVKFVKFVTLGAPTVDNIFFAYFTYNTNTLLSVASKNAKLILSDDGDAHYHGVPVLEDSEQFSNAKRLLDSMVGGFIASRLHGTTRRHFTKRVEYHHLLSSDLVPKNLFSETKGVSRSVLLPVLSKAYNQLLAEEGHNLDQVKYVVLGGPESDKQRNSSLSSAVLLSGLDNVRFKPHPRDNTVYTDLIDKGLMLPNYVPVEVLVGKFAHLVLVDNGSSAIRQCASLFLTKSITFNEFMCELNSKS
jgi:hypothetical protein